MDSIRSIQADRYCGIAKINWSFSAKMELAYCCDLAIVLAVFVLLTSNVVHNITRKKYFAQKTSLFTQKALLVFCITLMLCLTSRGVENRSPKKSLVKLYSFRCFPLKHFLSCEGRRWTVVSHTFSFASLSITAQIPVWDHFPCSQIFLWWPVDQFSNISIQNQDTVMGSH